MSHNYPYRTSPPHMLDHGAHGPGDSCDPLGNDLCVGNGLCAPVCSSASVTRSSVMPQENVLSLLSSCGLEPEDLARLVELPEDVLTVESLPHILQQMKDKKGVVKPYPSASTSSSSSASSFHYNSTSRPAIKVEQLRSQPVQYPLISSTRPPSEQGQEHWGTPRTSSSVRPGPPLSSSSSSGSMVDMDVRTGPPVYGKSEPGPSFNPIGQRLDSSHFLNSGPSDHQVLYHRVTPLLPQHPINENGKHHQKPWSSSSRSNQRPFSIPSMKQALDFHGTPQSVFPYTCSLCDITVLSEKVWTQHINSTLHADQQLNLLQEFPKWDCRVTSISSDDCQSHRQDHKAKNVFTAFTANHSQGAIQPSKSSQRKVKGKVVCVKFPPQSVDETYLRKLTEPFGRILKIVMFPSLAFVELGSVDQANDLVKFHVNYPPTVNGSQIEFSISSTFSFLQSSQVVSFTPAPEGEDGRSDLISIVKRFGMPLYTLFLPSKAYVEMKTVTEAQKLVDYYSANMLRISNDSIRVSFSEEHKSLTRLSSARRYEEHPASGHIKRERSRGKRTRTRSRSRDKKARTRSKSREKYEGVNGTRSKSAGISKREKTTRTRSTSRDKSNPEEQSRSCSRSRSRSRSQDDIIELSKSNQKPRSRSIGLSNSDKRSTTPSWPRSQDETRSPSNTETRSNSKETLEEPVELATDKPATVVESKPKAVDVTLMEEEDDEEDDDGLSVNSDIEGMEVIAEDGEELVDKDTEELEEDEDEEEEHKEEEDEEEHCPDVINQPPELGKEEKDMEKEEENEAEEMAKEEEKEEEAEKKEEEEEVEKEDEKKKEEAMKDTKPVAEEESEAGEEKKGESQVTCLEEEDEAFPLDPENFITLDELGEDDCAELSEEATVARESELDSSRVIYIRNLPPCFYSDADFFNVLRDCGTAVRYLLIRSRQEGFVEMSTPSEAAKAARELNARPTFLNKSKLKFNVSHKYHRLICGWTVKPDTDSESRKSRRRREASKRTPEKESRRDPAGRNSPDSELNNTSEEESGSQKTLYLKEIFAETQQRTESPEVKTQEKMESLDVATQQRTKSPDVEMSTTSKKEVLQISRTPQDKIQVNRNPESKKVKEDMPKNKSVPQTDLSSAEQPPGNEKNDNSKETEDGKLPGSLMKDKQVKVAEAEHEEEFHNNQTSFKPVGVEFVRPVVGYFCNLCQQIYADEDKAKQEHCSTLEHYRRYQEKTGKDPWTS